MDDIIEIKKRLKLSIEQIWKNMLTECQTDGYDIIKKSWTIHLRGDWMFGDLGSRKEYQTQTWMLKPWMWVRIQK